MGVLGLQQGATSEEMWIDESQIEAPAVRVLAVDQPHFRRGAEEIALDEAKLPRLVAPHTRVARPWLCAPTIRRHRTQGEFVARAGSYRVDAHESEYTQRPQHSLTLFHACRIERISGVQQQPAANHPRPRPHMQPV